MINRTRKSPGSLLIFLLIFAFSSCNQIAGQKTEDVENSKITQPADNERTEPEDISEAGDEADESQTVSEAVKFQTVSEEDIKFREDFTVPKYKTLSNDLNSNIKEAEGTFGGSSAIWYTIENAGIVYFYTQYDKDNSPVSEPEYINYAIVGDEYTLKCGIHVGMAREEVYDLLPDGIACKPGSMDGIPAPGVQQWNVFTFPEGWCENYEEVIMARIDYSEELPWYLGIMLDENGIVRAITTCYPTAG